MNEPQSETPPRDDVSPYLRRPVRTLREAKHDHETALLDLAAADSRPEPKG